jgi:hypothetical protein
MHFRKQTSHTRPEMAFEKEQTRRDYDNLTKELDALTREENKIKAKAGVSFRCWFFSYFLANRFIHSYNKTFPRKS